MRKFLLLLVSFSLITISAHSQPFPYTNEVTFINNTGTSYYNIQVRFDFFTSTFINANMMRPDGGDIRMYKDAALTNQIDYYIEGYINTDSTRIWVLLDSLPANSNTNVYCNFGNLAASPVSTLSIFDGPHSAVDSIAGGSTNTVSNSSRSFRFSPTQDLLVTDFGKNEPNGTTRYLTMWNYNTQQIIKQTQVSGSASVWSYQSLDQAFWLNSGIQYLMAIFQGTGDGYYYQTTSQIGQHLTYLDMRYCNNCTENTFPTLVLANRQYGYSDFLYYLRNGSYNPSYSISFVTNAGNENTTIPNTFALGQNYPNPFNPVTKIRYDIPQGSQVRLTVYDMLGREVTRLVDAYKDAGSYEVTWNGVNYTSGVYFYRLEAGSFTQEMKMILVK